MSDLPAPSSASSSSMSRPQFDVDSLCSKYKLCPSEKMFLESLRIGPDQQKTIVECDQRSDQWRAARVGRLTASRFGAARGHCQYTSKSELLRSMLWDTFKGNAATEYGTRNEPVAEQLYTRFQRRRKGLKDSDFFVEHHGLFVPLERPWLGVSPDGLVTDGSEPPHRRKGGLEIKCPFGRKMYPYIPSMYYDQIQGTMGILGIPWWDFVVWTPSQTHVERYEFDPKYFSDELLPRMECFYMRDYLPRAILKGAGLLEEGALDPVIEIPIEIDLDEKDKTH